MNTSGILRLRLLALPIAITLVLTAVMSIGVLATPAHAGFGVDVGDSGSQGGGGSTGSGGGGGGSGGGGGPAPVDPPAEDVMKLVKTTTTVNFSSSTAFATDTASCKSNPDNVGATVKYQYWYNSEDQSIKTGSTTVLSVACISLVKTTFVKQCVTRSEATIDQTVPRSRNITTGANDSGFLGSDRSPSSCDAARTNVSISATPDDYGRYSANAYAYRVPVTYLNVYNPLSGSNSASVQSIGAEYMSKSVNASLQLTCSGWTTAWSGNPNFTFTDCGPTTPAPTYQCVPASGSIGSTTVDGVASNSATLFRDGSEHVVRWDILEPTSELTVSGSSTRWTRSGTPWRENGLSVADANFALASAPDGRNLFTSDSGTSWVGGSHDSAYVKGFWASTNGQPTLIHPQWNYTGTMQSQTFTITGFDGNNFTYASSWVTVDSSGICSAGDASLNYVRATGK